MGITDMCTTVMRALPQLPVVNLHSLPEYSKYQFGMLQQC